MNRSIKSLLDQIQQERRLRIWSLIITFLGDAIAPRGGEVSAKTIQQLMERLGIEPGAVRTALSRLTSDGWIIREKRGRRSYFKLSQTGHASFQEASKRIYGAVGQPDDVQSSVSLIIADTRGNSQQSAVTQSDGVFELQAGVFLSFDPRLSAVVGVADNYLMTRISPSQLPAWARNKLGPESIAGAYRSLQTLFACKSTFDVPVPVDAMALRCLLIHEWRRLILRYPEIPSNCLPDDWPLEGCRLEVARLYWELLADSESWLDGSDETNQQLLDTRNRDFEWRFKSEVAG